MKTNEITAAEFSAKFGTDTILPGPFSYFISDNGVGVIKDNNRKSIEVITTKDIELTDISVEDELLLLTLVCGEYKEEITIPKVDTFENYEARDRSAKGTLYIMWIILIVILAICALSYFYIY